MTRVKEARELKRQGFNGKEIAEKMGICTATVYCYLSGSGERRRKKQFGNKTRSIIREELSSFELPLEWEDELMKMFAVYHYSGRERGGSTKLHIQSFIQLLCRRYKVPTPRKLETLTYQGNPARKTSGYMDVLQMFDGVSISKPIDYVKYFIERENLPEEEISQANELIEKIPKVHRQSRNPRVLAGVVLYDIHKPTFSTVKLKRIYTQRYIADALQVTEASLRANWVKFFK